jgi:hypothetical protein
MPAEPTADVEALLAGLDDRLRELRGRLDTMRRDVAQLDGASRTAAPTADREARGYLSLAPEPGAGIDPVDPRAAHLLYERVCRRLRILPVSLAGSVLTLATADPGDRFAHNVAHALTGKPLEVAAAIPEEIDAAIDRVFAPSPAPEPAPHVSVSDGRSAHSEREPRLPLEQQPEPGPAPPTAERPASGPDDAGDDPVFSRVHWAVGIVIALIVAAGVVVAPLETAIALVTTCVVIRTLLSLYEFRLRRRSG